MSTPHRRPPRGRRRRLPARPGLGRFWAVREQYDTAAFRRHCQRLAAAVAGAIEARVQQGEEIVLVGVEGSPSMGATITSSDPQRGGRPAWPDGSPELTGGEGIFVEELHAELGQRGITTILVTAQHGLIGAHMGSFEALRALENPRFEHRGIHGARRLQHVFGRLERMVEERVGKRGIGYVLRLPPEQP